MVTAGPTQESLDPVRFISNHSSGRMGIEVAKECAERGAQVFLVLGPTSLTVSHKNIKVIKVRSAADMYQACMSKHTAVDTFVFAAAVADYTPEEESQNKIKKKDEDLAIPLKRTKDIAGSIGKVKGKHQLSVGFALETNNESANAQRKLDKKNFDLIVLNSLREKGAGFGHQTNKVTFFKKDGSIQKFDLKPKSEVAVDIVNAICSLRSNK